MFALALFILMSDANTSAPDSTLKSTTTSLTVTPANSAETPIQGSQVLLSTFPIEPQTPAEILVKQVIKLEEAVKGIDEAKGEEAKKKDDAVRSIISDILAIDKLGQRALQTYWDELGQTDRGKKQRDQYSKLFRNLVEENYLEKIRVYVSGKYRIPLVGQKTSNSGMIVTGRIKKPDVDLIVDFIFERIGSDWRIVDIKLDETSLEGTYRSSFNRTIRKNGGLKTGFPELLSMMEKRLSELRKGRATKI